MVEEGKVRGAMGQANEQPKKLYYLTDPGPGWVQSWRVSVFKELLSDEFKIEDISRSFFIRRHLPKIFFTPCYVSSWRQLIKNDLYKRLPLDQFLTSVTSHYNLGGGLNPAKTTGTKITDLDIVYKKAIGILSRFKVVTVNSQILHDFLSSDLKNIIYAPNGVDPEFFKPVKPRHEFNPEQIVIGWVGKIKGAKNYELVEELKKIISSGELQGVSLKEIAIDKNHPDVQSKEKVRDTYTHCDFYLCTSWHEGTPNPCLEAAACGIPIISTRVGNMPEFIKEGENGFFIDPSIESLKTVINNLKKLTPKSYEHLGSHARNEIMEHWTWRKQIINYRVAFERLFE
jgi:glycosyltransferase involved in cell wall biosynthesis